MRVVVHSSLQTIFPESWQRVKRVRGVGDSIIQTNIHRSKENGLGAIDFATPLTRLTLFPDSGKRVWKLEFATPRTMQLAKAMCANPKGAKLGAVGHLCPHTSW